MKTSLIITSIADNNHPVLQQYAKEAAENNVRFIVIGDSKSPSDFYIENCDFYSLSDQKKISPSFSELLPEKHYARKNLGYLEAIKSGTTRIIETDDDNIPMPAFWNFRELNGTYEEVSHKGWVNVYRYFSKENIWPRGLPLTNIQDIVPEPKRTDKHSYYIQQGLADGNPDVDAIYRLVLEQKDIQFDKKEIVLGKEAWCPFNSQNTTWFKDAFPLLYLPSYCSFRMTDIWRSFIAQRIAWTCDWKILFHYPTVYQERNEHDLMKDFNDEISGYQNNEIIRKRLENVDFKNGIKNIPDNMLKAYKELIYMNLVGKKEIGLVDKWLNEITKYI